MAEEQLVGHLKVTMPRRGRRMLIRNVDAILRQTVNFFFYNFISVLPWFDLVIKTYSLCNLQSIISCLWYLSNGSKSL